MMIWKVYHIYIIFRACFFWLAWMSLLSWTYDRILITILSRHSDIRGVISHLGLPLAGLMRQAPTSVAPLGWNKDIPIHSGLEKGPGRSTFHNEFCPMSLVMGNAKTSMWNKESLPPLRRWNMIDPPDFCSTHIRNSPALWGLITLLYDSRRHGSLHHHCRYHRVQYIPVSVTFLI